MSRPATLGLVALGMGCFAANSLLTRYLVGGGWLDPAAVTIARFAAGAAMLALILGLQGRARDAWPKWSDAPPVLFLGGYALAIAYGYRFITAAAGTFVFYALVIFTMALGGGRPTRRAVGGALLALAGVGVMAVGRVAGTTPLGVVLLGFTGATWGLYSLALRRRGAPLAVNARSFVGVALLLPVLAWVEAEALQWTIRGVVLGVFMGAVTTALAYALWARVLPRLSVLEAGTFQLSVPVLTAAAGLGVLDEPFSLRLACAGVLVLAGMWLASRPPAAETPAR